MKIVQGQSGDFFAPAARPKRSRKKDAISPWRPIAPIARGEWSGPLQEIRTAVPEASEWIIVSQEFRTSFGALAWRTSAIHPNQEWDGTLPFTSKALGFFVPCHESWTVEGRDLAIADILRIFALPMSGPKRDFTCPSCHIMERDGATNRPAGKLCVYCGK
jgi:hypothetical protein